jgi:hypothetical protein
MKYRIELAATAKADIRGQAQWLREQVSPAAADKWLAGLYKAIDTLQARPLRCPVAAENDKFPEEIRAGLLVGETCSGRLNLRARFAGSLESRAGGLFLGLDRLSDQKGPVIGLDASHLPLLVDGRADSSCRSGGFPELDDDRQQRLLQFLGIGVQHDQAVQDPLPQRLAGNVRLLVPGPGAGRRSTCRK